jgi:hypothetical protein
MTIFIIAGIAVVVLVLVGVVWWQCNKRRQAAAMDISKTIETNNISHSAFDLNNLAYGNEGVEGHLQMSPFHANVMQVQTHAVRVQPQHQPQHEYQFEHENELQHQHENDSRAQVDHHGHGRDTRSGSGKANAIVPFTPVLPPKAVPVHALKAGWSQHTDEYGRLYYWNEMTEESSWTVPS